ncbi:MAG: hypothetical protein ACOVNL_07130 [Prochlorococcaceae cyanobacterium]
MATPSEAADPTLRLAEQLQALSLVTETLTYRLLDLEERLAAQEVHSRQTLEAEQGAVLQAAEATELRLLETEDRLARLEAVLSEGTTAAPSEPPIPEEPPRLQVVPPAAPQGELRLDACEPHEEDDFPTSSWSA